MAWSDRKALKDGHKGKKTTCFSNTQRKKKINLWRCMRNDDKKIRNLPENYNVFEIQEEMKG